MAFEPKFLINKLEALRPSDPDPKADYQDCVSYVLDDDHHITGQHDDLETAFQEAFQRLGFEGEPVMEAELAAALTKINAQR